MIAILQPGLDDDAGTTIAPDIAAEVAAKVTAMFEPAGALAGMPVDAPADSANIHGFVFEERPQQRAMALAVAQAVLAPRHLAVEAGTGVGKTFAYLAPLLLMAAAGKKPVAVSTHTINLQEQLVRRDIPFLRQRLNLDLKAVICKGRNNYLCLRRLFLARHLGPDLFDHSQAASLEMLARMAGEMSMAAPAPNQDAADGTLSAFSDGNFEPPRPDLWRQVCAEHDNCLGRKCRYYRRCFLMRARAAAFDADLLVLNHHLLFSNLAMGLAPGAEGMETGFLPAFDTLVLDEAHCMEATASEHFGLRLTQGGMEFWLRRLYGGGSRMDDGAQSRQKKSGAGRGLMAVLGDAAGAQILQRAWHEADIFFKTISQWAAFDGRETRRVVKEPMDCAGMLADRLRETAGLLRKHAGNMEDPDMQAELQAQARRGMAMCESLQAFMRQTLENQVYWVEAESAVRSARVGHAKYNLCSAPIDVAPILQSALFGGFESVVLTSATLSVAGDLKYFKARVGAADVEELIVSSPFNYSRQMRLYFVEDMPDPRAENFGAALQSAIRFFLAKTAGRAFVLFTNAALMRDTALQMADFFAEHDMNLLAQGQGLSRHAMLERFRYLPRAVLFGLDSFWMGVDVRGAALSNVIITRLPFAVPDEPVTKARMDLIKARGGDAFREYSLPEAVLKFRQGVGRLIRSTTDEGMVAVLDSRIHAKNYGRVFLKAIPECPVEFVQIEFIPPFTKTTTNVPPPLD